jgi:SpoVK/Ycf46/Vps4 family AAA+-type ATPase
LITFWADEQLLGDMDGARGHKDRSLFIREAIAEKLRREGRQVPERLIHPPPRARERRVARIHVKFAPPVESKHLAKVAEQKDTYHSRHTRRKGDQ